MDHSREFSADNAETKSPLSVLIVEDHLLTRIGLKTLLSRAADMRVVGEASNGQEAIAMCARLSPDVVLMDVGMPVMDGIEAARTIVQTHDNIHVIMLTSHDNEQDVWASLSAGANGYCLKEVDPERLYTAIRSVHAGDLWIDAAIATRLLGQFCADKQAAAGKGPHLRAVPSFPLKETHALPDVLSPREVEVLILMSEGLSNRKIAEKLAISISTAKAHVRNILNKLAVGDRAKAALQARRAGLS